MGIGTDMWDRYDLPSADSREADHAGDRSRASRADARIEYEDCEGRTRHEDLEVVTGHYRGAHSSAAARSGFTRYRSLGCTVGGRSGRRTLDPRLAEEFLGSRPQRRASNGAS